MRAKPTLTIVPSDSDGCPLDESSFDLLIARVALEHAAVHRDPSNRRWTRSSARARRTSTRRKAIRKDVGRLRAPPRLGLLTRLQVSGRCGIYAHAGPEPARGGRRGGAPFLAQLRPPVLATRTTGRRSN